MSISAIVAIIGEVSALLAFATPIVIWIKKLSNGSKCQLRSEMLRIYYHNKETEKIRQYEYENFVSLYEAYKELGGNSFIDKIYDEVKEFEIVT